MDERRTLRTLGWIVGGVVFACLVLSAVSMAGDQAPAVATMTVATAR